MIEISYHLFREAQRKFRQKLFLGIIKMTCVRFKVHLLNADKKKKKPLSFSR